MNKTYDLIVVGAGVLGTFHAYHALRRGLSVLLLEKDSRPKSATVRNFGQVVPSGMKNPWFEYGRRSLEIYQDIQQNFDISVRKMGSVYIASDTEEQQLLHELKSLFDEKDYACQLLSSQQCLQRWPALRADYVREGLFFPDELSVEPIIMIRRLLHYMQEHFEQFTFLTSCPVNKLEAEPEHVRLLSNLPQPFYGKNVLICSGAEFKLLFPEIFQNSGLVVSKLQMMRSRPMPGVSLPGNILTGLTIRRYESFTECPSFAQLSTPAHYQPLKDWGIHILFKQSADGSIILGDSHEYAPAAKSDELGYEIREQVNQLIIKEAERIVSFKFDHLESSWAGFYSQHPDEFFFKKVDQRIHILTGIGGKGMTSSAGFAEQNLDAILQEDGGLSK